MNTQTHVHRLEAGQALPAVPRSAGPVVLSEGELLLQEPARWLAGTVVLPRPVRLVAPAVVPAAPEGCIIAVRASVIVAREPAPSFSMHRLLAAANRLLRRGRSVTRLGHSAAS